MYHSISTWIPTSIVRSSETPPCCRSLNMAETGAVQRTEKERQWEEKVPDTVAADTAAETAASVADEPNVQEKPLAKPGCIRAHGPGRSLPIAKVYKEQVKRWVVSMGTKLPLEVLYVDYNQSERQTRPLDNTEVKRKLPLNLPLEMV